MDTSAARLLVGTCPPLTREEEQYWFKQLQSGNEQEKRQAQEKIVKANMAFALKIAKEYLGGPLSLSELFSEATDGLLLALEKFDPDHKVKFISYAVWWIRQRIVRALRDSSHIFRVPETLLKTVTEIKEHGKPSATVEELSQQLASSTSQVQKALTILNGVISLEAPPYPYSQDKGFPSRHESITQSTQDQKLPDAELEEKERKKFAWELVSLLTERERHIIVHFFGLLPKERQQTLTEIGKDLGLSRERIRQIKKIALGKMRKQAELYSSGVKTFRRSSLQHSPEEPLPTP